MFQHEENDESDNEEEDESDDEDDDDEEDELNQIKISDLEPSLKKVEQAMGRVHVLFIA